MRIPAARLVRIDLTTTVDLNRVDETTSQIPPDALHLLAEIAAIASGCGYVGIAYAVAPVPDGRPRDVEWLVCAAQDRIGLGLLPGEAFRLDAAEPADEAEPPVASDFTDPTARTLRFDDVEGLQVDRLELGSGVQSGRSARLKARPIRRGNKPAGGMLFLIEADARDPVGSADPASDADPVLAERRIACPAELASLMLEQHSCLVEADRQLAVEHETAALREVFIASLGHELRNPLAAIDAGTTVLQNARHPGSTAMLGIIRRSVDRLSGLVENLNDIARGRFGSGLVVERDASQPLWPMLEQVVDELRVSSPGRRIETRIERDVGLPCDRRRIAQLLSNLLANAINHGAADTPIEVTSAIHDGQLTISVANGGEPLPPAELKRIFLPFARGAARDGQRSGSHGLGLGLTICNEIARAHGGTLDVISTVQLTRFMFRMPIG